MVGLGGPTRQVIFDMFIQRVYNPIIELDLKCEIWLDGSFITRCAQPSDLDGSLMVGAEVIDSLNQEALTYLKNFDDYTPALPKELDLYLCPVYPRGHPLREDMNDPDGWAEQWSIERNSDWLKGFVVIPFR